MKKNLVNQVEESQDLIPVNENDQPIVAPVEQVQVFGDDGSQYVMAMTGERKVSYSSIDQSKLSFQEKAKFFNLINGKAEEIKEHVNEKILLKDIYLEIVDVVDMQTGEPKKLPRQVLIDVDGKAYTCSSPTFASKLASLVACLGAVQTWTEPLPITFRQVKTNKGFQALTLETSF